MIIGSARACAGRGISGKAGERAWGHCSRGETFIARRLQRTLSAIEPASERPYEFGATGEPDRGRKSLYPQQAGDPNAIKDDAGNLNARPQLNNSGYGAFAGVDDGAAGDGMGAIRARMGTQ